MQGRAREQRWVSVESMATSSRGIIDFLGLCSTTEHYTVHAHDLLISSGDQHASYSRLTPATPPLPAATTAAPPRDIPRYCPSLPLPPLVKFRNSRPKDRPRKLTRRRRSRSRRRRDTLKLSKCDIRRPRRFGPPSFCRSSSTTSSSALHAHIVWQ